MSGLPVPIPASIVPGQFDTAALWNANVYNGVTFLLNPPVAVLMQSAVQSIPNSTTTVVALDSSVTDPYGGHSNTVNNSRYTAQVSGWYLAIASVGYTANATGNRVINLQKNGAVLTPGVSAYPAAGAANGHISQVITVVYMNAGDYLEISAYQTSGGSLSTQAPQTSLAILFIHA